MRLKTPEDYSWITGAILGNVTMLVADKLLSLAWGIFITICSYYVNRWLRNRESRKNGKQD